MVHAHSRNMSLCSPPLALLYLCEAPAKNGHTVLKKNEIHFYLSKMGSCESSPFKKYYLFFLKKNILFCGQHFLMLIFLKNNEMCREIDTSYQLIFVGELTRSLYSSICSSYLAKCNRLTDIKNCLLENSHFKRNTFFITFFFKHGTFQYSCRSEVEISTRGGKHLICIRVESPETVSSRKSAKMLQQQYYF